MCHIEREIAEYCNQDESTVCYGCEQTIPEDEEMQEVKTHYAGLQWICMECIEDYVDNGVAM